MKEVGTRLKEAREAAGISQAALDELAGYPRGRTNNYESGLVKRIDPDYLERVAMVLKRPVGWFVGEDRASYGTPARGPIVYWGELPASDWQEPKGGESLAYVPREFSKHENRLGRIKGDSMRPRLERGDFIIIKLTEGPPVGSIVLARAGSEMTVKRLVENEEGVYELRALNKSTPPLEPRDATVVGYVIGIIPIAAASELIAL